MVNLGYQVLPVNPLVTDWAVAAYQEVLKLDTSERRHGGTWFVGVDALSNATDGSVDGVPMPFAHMSPHWHAAQVSIVYDGYPSRDKNENESAHLFRLNRDAAHMDGLLPEHPNKRRHLREPHAFIIGMALNEARASPLVVWEGSQHVMTAAFRRIFDEINPVDFGDLDVTNAYQVARREVFDTCRRVEVPTSVGEAVILHRHLIHGVAPWAGDALKEGRIIAYFRPLADYDVWL